MPRGTGSNWRYDQAQLQGRLWTPHLIRNRLALWLDAADLSTISVATGGSFWRDKSGLNNHAAQSTTATQPTFTLGGFNDQGCFTFTGSQYLLVPHTASLNLSAYTLIGAVDDNATTDSFRAWVEKANDGLPYIRKFWIGTSSSFYTFNHTIVADSENNTVRLLGNVNMSAQIVVHTKPESGTAFLFQNGTQTASDTTIGNNSINTNPLAIGGRFYPWIGTIGEVILISQVLPTQERFLVEGYLAWKWHVPLVTSHPFATRPPLIGD